ncbi:MAG TPA: CRTAC1 family protein, partial [Longimicrobiales bacterium]
AARPDNLVALVERARIAARAGDRAALGRALARIAARAGAQAAVSTQLAAVRGAAAAGDLTRAATQIGFLETELQPLPTYAADASALVLSPGRSELLLTRFVRLQTPSARSDPPDTGLTFTPKRLAMAPGPWGWLRLVWLSDRDPLALVAANRSTVWISSDPTRAESHPFPGGQGRGPLSASAIAAIDYDYDFKVDLALAGEGGLRLLRQDSVGSFRDVTAAAIPADVARGSYTGAWAADLDMDGDLDLVLGSTDGPPLVLSNRGDGTFERAAGFEGISRLRDFAWADLDADGDPDAVLLDGAGGLHVLLNQRAQTPRFRAMPLPPALGPIQAMAVADLAHDGSMDLALLQADGSLVSLSLAGGQWRLRALARWPGFSPSGVEATRLLAADLDNNGDLDLLASTPAGTRVWLSRAGGWQPLRPLADRITDLADLSGSGRLDLFGFGPSGDVVWLSNRGARDYASTTISPRAASATGDRRINPFGIGGEIELRAGLLYQKQVISGPALRFGLGQHRDINVVRTIWPNGTSQAEFNLPARNEIALARQRLKGSCPWLFAFDGRQLRFVTDFIWRTALGLRINAQGKAAVVHSEDWVRIRGDQLAPRDGFYDVRITAELWETHFFDQVALMVVDHPLGTEVFADERFTVPAPVQSVHALGPLHPIALARDEVGRDVTALVRDLDGRYLDTFQLGPYQGLAQEHYVEVELGDDAPAGEALWLVASGWVYPTDSSINVAISQGRLAPPHGLQLEVPDGRGGWVVAVPDLGFPEGKTKTILIDLSHVFRPGTPRLLRLRTNMEVYWDRIAWAVGRPDTPLRTTRIRPSAAELRFRGFSVVHQAGRRAPELPLYDSIAGSTQLWRDLVGYYTRFGDVRALVDSVDDRYVIMNAGDELALRFPALPPPAAGWARDFVLIGDGWVKDGDFNTGYSTAVLPLPYHGLADYSRPPGRLQDDPAYRRHPDDWRVYHTRYVTPQEFQYGLVPR